jgi:hypothetical protein
MVLRALQRLNEFSQGTAGDDSHEDENIAVPNLGTNEKSTVGDFVAAKASTN